MVSGGSQLNTLSSGTVTRVGIRHTRCTVNHLHTDKINMNIVGSDRRELDTETLADIRLAGLSREACRQFRPFAAHITLTGRRQFDPLAVIVVIQMTLRVGPIEPPRNAPEGQGVGRTGNDRMIEILVEARRTVGNATVVAAIRTVFPIDRSRKRGTVMEIDSRIGRVEITSGVLGGSVGNLVHRHIPTYTGLLKARVHHRNEIGPCPTGQRQYQHNKTRDQQPPVHINISPRQKNTFLQLALS